MPWWRQDATRFLDAFTAGAPVEPASYFYLWDRPTKTTTSFLVQDTRSIATATSWDQAPNDVYVGVALGAAPLARHKRITNQTAAGIAGVHLDIDVLGPAHSKLHLPPSVDAGLELMEEFGAPPSVVVLSGHGVQAWWLFPRPWMFADAAEAADAGDLLKGWVGAQSEVAASHGWQHDSVGDLARLMRLPGTINAKLHDDPVNVQLLSDDGPRYDVDQLRALIDRKRPAVAPVGTGVPTEPDEQATFTVDAAAEPPAAKLHALLQSPRALDSWEHNRLDFADQSPSTYDLSLAAMAVRAQWSDQEIVDLMIACRRHNQCRPKLRADYFRRTLTRARLDDSTSAAEPGEPDDESWSTRIRDYGLIPVLADAVEDEQYFAHDDSGVVYRFAGGRYVDATPWLHREVRELLEAGQATKTWRASAPTQLSTYLGAVAPRLWPRPPHDALNVENGLLDIASGTLRPHSPQHLSTVQLPVRYDPDAQCPRIDRFVRETFPDDAFELAYQLLAMVMVPDPSVQKAVLLLGPGGNGKSVLLRLWQTFLGTQNCSAVPLQRLDADRFASSRLDGKLANICADLPSTDLKGSSVFKSITGGDRITAERKYHDSYDLHPHCKLIFSANAPPRTPDASDAFFQRWIVVPFERTLRGEAAEVSSRELDALLQDPHELSGMLNRALAALPGVRTDGVSEPLSCLAAREMFRGVTDPVSVWLDQHVLSTPGAYVTKAHLLEEYNASAIRGGRPTMTANAFSRTLRRHRPNLQSGQRQGAGRVVWVWLDMTLRSHALAADPTADRDREW